MNGSKRASPPVVCLAPMAGFTDWPMRVLCYRMGAQYACTEMVSAMGYVCAKPGNEVYRLLLATHPEETNTACQLFGRDPVVMGEAAARVSELGRFASLDINMGCPARKVVGIGEGSALLLDVPRAARIMEAVKRNTHLPVTVKTRLSYDGVRGSALELGEAAQALGMAWLCVHGRTREQQYAGEADHAAIGELKARLSLPVIANGDIDSPAQALRAANLTGADGLMIGRAAVGNPWVMRAVRAALEGAEAPPPPSVRERVQTAILHAQWMAQSKGERRGVLEMRAHAGRYVGGVRGATALRREMNHQTTLDGLVSLLRSIADRFDQEEEIL